MKHVLGVGESGAFSLIDHALTVADDIVGRSLATFPGVHSVLESFTAWVANVAGYTVSRLTLIGIIITWNRTEIRNKQIVRICACAINLQAITKFCSSN
jgi:hypothetical protein